MASVYLSLGSNIGNREANIARAIDEIADRIGTVVCYSSLYETEPYGFVSPNNFINAVAEIVTELEPIDLLDMINGIEWDMGRRRATEKIDVRVYEDRIIDIDILTYDEVVINSARLVIPHPGMFLRRFVIEPLVEIAPMFRHPVSGMSAVEALDLLM